MTTATQSGFWAWFAGPRTETKTGPEVKPRPGPIFIHDAVVPLRNSTLLLEILRKDAAEADNT